MEIDKEKEFQKLMEDPGNKVCCDCGIFMNITLGNDSPQWCSVSNGIFICFICSAVHRSLGIQMSYVKSILMDAWDIKEFSMMKEGGNTKFKAFMEECKLTQELPNVKYKTKAAAYYRKRVRLLYNNIA